MAERLSVLPLTRTEQIVDLNYLYQRQQVSQFWADNADSDEVRRVHRDFAERYAARIAEARTSRTHLKAV